MTTTTTTLADFLLARIAEDEVVSRAAADAAWSYGDDEGPFLGNDAYEEMCGLAEGEGASIEATAHATHYSPARVLAECAAKRAMVAEFRDTETVLMEYEQDHDDAAHLWSERYEALKPTMRHLASVHADHPDYDESWRP